MTDMFGIDYYALSGLRYRFFLYEGLHPSHRYTALLGLLTTLNLKGSDNRRKGVTFPITIDK